MCLNEKERKFQHNIIYVGIYYNNNMQWDDDEDRENSACAARRNEIE